MPRHPLRYTFIALIGAVTASPAMAQDIVVTGPGEHVVGRTNFGADVVEYTASLAVDVRDLDLASAAGWHSMERRLTDASNIACNVIDQRIPVDLRPDSSECQRIAYRGAIARARKLTKKPADASGTAMTGEQVAEMAPTRLD